MTAATGHPVDSVLSTSGWPLVVPCCVLLYPLRGRLQESNISYSDTKELFDHSRSRELISSKLRICFPERKLSCPACQGRAEFFRGEKTLCERPWLQAICLLITDLQWTDLNMINVTRLSFILGTWFLNASRKTELVSEATLTEDRSLKQGSNAGSRITVLPELDNLDSL